MLNLIKFLDIVAENDRVPAEELGKYWEVFEILAIIICTVPWIILIIYLIFFKKFIVNFYVDNELVNVVKYKKNQLVNQYSYNDINIWYTDCECTNVYDFSKPLDSNIKLYALTFKDE